MIKHEIITRSPLRILEKSTHGGVGKGNIGVIASRKGTGKTACLVHIATDQLFQGKNLIHVSFSADTAHIVSWYEHIFEEIARRYKLDCAMDVHDDIIKNRVIMNFRQDGVSAEQVQRSLRSMILDGNFTADLIIIDGYDFSKVSAEEFSSFKRFAQDMGIGYGSVPLCTGKATFCQITFLKCSLPLSTISMFLFCSSQEIIMFI